MAQIPSRVPVPPRGRVDFLRDGFRNMVLKNGMSVTWERVRECPCLLLTQEQVTLNLGNGFAPAVVAPRVPSTRQHRPDCPDCGGKGVVWNDAQTIVAYVSHGSTTELAPDWVSIIPKSGHRIRSKDKEHIPTGELRFTLLAEHRPMLGDRYTMTQNVVTYKETHFYLGEPVSRLMHPIHITDLDTDPASTSGVRSCFVTGPDLNVAVSGEELIPGVDLTPEPDGSGVRWINPPELNGRFSIVYYGLPRFVVTEIPHSFRDHFQLFRRPTPELERDVVQAICMEEALAAGRATGANG